MVRDFPRLASIPVLLLLALLGGCDQQKQSSGPGQPRKAADHLVQIQTLQPRQVGMDYLRTGALKYRKLVRIYSQETGRITALPWFEGDYVEQGKQLVKLDDELLAAELAKARANTRQAQQDLSRFEELHRKKVASKDELLRAKTALDIAMAEQQILVARVGYTDIRAPFTGIITERLSEPGDVVPKHAHILTLADPQSLITQLSVSELLLPHLKPGDEVEMRIDALGRTVHTGRIMRIHPDVDANTKQGQIEVQLQPVPEGARAGQFARVTLKTSAAQRLLIPFTALRRDRLGEFVYLLEQSRASRVPVQSGLKIGDRIEILQGLDAGDKIIIKGFMGLSDNKQVVPKPAK